MLDILFQIEKNLKELLTNSELHTMYIDYHLPFVKRVWFQYGVYRVYLHCIEPCDDATEALYHPHPWKSAIRLIKGKYEMGIGHSESNEIPKTDCTLILPQGSCYEMVEKDAWHYVRPIDNPVYSLMVTGELNDRETPLEPSKTFRELNKEEIDDILSVFREYYFNETYLSIGTEIVEIILKNKEIDIEEFLLNTPIKQSDRRKFYTHVSTLFLNVLLNRLHEFSNPEEIEELSNRCRKQIVSLLKVVY